MISQFEEIGHRHPAKGNALAKLMRRTVPEDISRDPVDKSLNLHNLQPRAEDQPREPIQKQQEATVSQSVTRESSEYDSDGEPRLPPPSIGRGLPTDFNLRFWDKSPNQAPSSGKKRKASTGGIDAYFSKNQSKEGTSVRAPDDIDTVEEPDVIPTLDYREKLKHCGALEAQLSRLKDNMLQLEQTLQDVQSSRDDAQFDSRRLDTILPLLVTDNPACTPSDSDQKIPPLSSLLTSLLPFSTLQYAPEPINDEVPDSSEPTHLENQTDYLNLFAPLSLSIETEPYLSQTTPDLHSNEHGGIIQKYKLTLSAPTSFSHRAFNVAVTTAIDVVAQRIAAIDVPTTQTIPLNLRKWIDARLSDQLFTRDISGLCWGICQYWEAMLKRAELWSQLEKWRESVSQGAPASQASSSGTSSPNIALNINRSSFLVRAGKVNRGIIQTLTTCEICLDPWTGEAHLKPDFSVLHEGSNAQKIEAASSTTFRSILHQNRGPHHKFDASEIAKAVEIVSSIVLGA